MLNGSLGLASQGMKRLVTDRAFQFRHSSGPESDFEEITINIAAAIRQEPTTAYLKYMAHSIWIQTITQSKPTGMSLLYQSLLQTRACSNLFPILLAIFRGRRPRSPRVTDGPNRQPSHRKQLSQGVRGSLISQASGATPDSEILAYYIARTPRISFDCGSTTTIRCPTLKYSSPRHVGWMSITVWGSATRRTERGTTVPTDRLNLT
jgi:hypothetical protein